MSERDLDEEWWDLIQQEAQDILDEIYEKYTDFDWEGE